MSSQDTSNPENQQALLKIFKALTSTSAQVLLYGSALLAIAVTGGAVLPEMLGSLATGVGMNLIANMIERVARGDDIHEEEIRKVVVGVINTSGIEKLATSNELQRIAARLFRQFDLLTYAVRKGDIAIASLIKQFELISEQNTEILETLRQIERILDSLQLGVFPPHYFPTSLVNQKIEDEIKSLRQARFFPGFDIIRPALTLAKQLVDGEYRGGNNALRGRSLAWCVRFLSRSDELARAESYLTFAKELGSSPEIGIATAFILSQKGDKNAALDILANINTPSSRSAALMVVAHHSGSQAAIDWLNTVSISVTDLDADGKSFLLSHLLQLAQWDAARGCLDALKDEDFYEAPILYHFVAIHYLISTVPSELRLVVLNQLPNNLVDFPLASDGPAIGARREAHRYFITASNIARKLNCLFAATIDDDYALWLELMDPDESDKGRQRLLTKLRDPESALRLIHLGLQYGVHLDLEMVTREIERQIALHGEITQNAAIARFALIFTKQTPEDSANYLAQHRDELVKYYDKKWLRYIEIELLSKAGQLESARTCLKQLIDEGLSGNEENHLRRTIAEAEGADRIESRREQFKESGSLVDLVSLIYELETKNEWESLCEYSQILSDKTHALSDAERHATALSKTQKTKQLLGFLKSNAELIPQSKNLQMLHCWALYQEGDLIEARSGLANLSEDWDDASYRALRINLGITLGDWTSLSSVVINECLKKEKRSAQELISSAQLALYLGMNHAKELLFAAAEKGSEDAGVLATAYFLASKAGWEKDEYVSTWLHNAAALSGENGPIQKKTIKDFLDWKPDWDRRVSGIWQSLTHGNIPIFLAAYSLNKSLIDLVLFPALANLLESDPRRRSAIPAYCGNRRQVQLKLSGTVGIDPTALLTLGFLNLFDKAFEAFDTIYVSHTTLEWLFEEKQKSDFHQLSRIIDAHQIHNLLATDVLEKLIPSTLPDSDLSSHVGDELAVFIAEAEKGQGGNGIQRIVVRPFPVYRISSLMEEEADLSQHAAVLSSCQSVVDKVRQKGQLTAEEASRARDYLKLNEKPWPNQPEIADGAILYLENLAMNYFLHLGLLERIKAAGFRLVASPSEIAEANALISYENISGKIKEVTERIRLTIHTQIESGKIKVGRLRNIDSTEKQKISKHPSVGVFALAKDCDAFIVDDRFLNQHAFLEEGSSQAPIFTTLDLIEALVSAGSITLQDRLEYRTQLRRAGYFFIPLCVDELESQLLASPIKVDEVMKTAELKAIQENILQIRMSSWLQFPKEACWLDLSFQAFIRVLKNLWKPNSDLLSVKAYSDWVLDQVDVRGWAHRLSDENREYIINLGRGEQILILLTPPQDASREIQIEYWNWVEDRVLSTVKEQFPELYTWIVNFYKGRIAQTTEMNLTEGSRI